MTAKIKTWQWPNVLAIDASIVSVAWLGVFAEMQSAHPGISAYAVLALSVWLTYLSDRLFDASPRRESQLLSTRHQFAKRRIRLLWPIWAALLVATVITAAAGLNGSQLKKGFVLLLLCLAYTGLNHSLSKRFFPKELIVAVIFAGGTQVFLPEHTRWQWLAGFFLLCLINCLMISWKEKAVDARLEVRSIASTLNLRWGYALLALGLGLSLGGACTIALLPPMLALFFLQACRNRFGHESFRVLCDSAMLLGPLLYFVGSGALTR